MADKDARVRLNLSAAGLLTSLREVTKQADAFEKELAGLGDAAEKSSRKTSGLFGAMKTGLGGAKSELTALGGQLKSVLGMAVTLGGSLSLASAVHEAQLLTRSYRDIAFAIRTGTGEAVTAAQVQQQVEATAGRWKVRTSEVKDSYAALFQETGNLKFTESAINSVAKAHVATGKSVATLTSLAGLLNDKFGITADKLDDTIAGAIELSNKGGVSLEDLGQDLGELGAIAKTAGLTGQEGFERMVGLLNIADGPMKNMKQSLRGLKMLFEGLVDPDRAKLIEKTLGVKVTDKDGNMRGDALERIFAKTRGKQQELAKVFSGQELRLVTDLGKTFATAFEETKGDVKTKTAAALEAYRQSLDKAAKVATTGADIEKEAAGRLNESHRNVQAAMNDFVKALERPEIVDAIDKVAEAAPKFARVFGDLVGFATKHPLLAAGAAVGGVAAKGALTAVVTKVSDSAMDSAGKLLGKSIETLPAWGLAGKAVGASFVVGAGAAGYLIGQKLADYLLDRDKAKKEATEAAAADAESMAKHGTGSPEKRKAAADALRTQIAQMEKDGGPSFYTKLVGSYASKFGDVEHPEAEFQKRLANARQQLAALEGGQGVVPPIGPPPPPGGVVPPTAPPSKSAEQIAKEVANGGGEPRKTVITNEQALATAVARQLGGVTLNVRVQGGGAGTNGLPPAPGNGSGSAPL